MSETLAKRLLIVMNVVGALLLAAAVASGQELKVVGKTRTVVVVETLPFKVEAEAGGALYRWRVAEGVVNNPKSNVVEITSAPKGELVVSVEYVKIDFDKKTFTEVYKEVTVVVGDVPPGPKPPDPKPIPPSPAPIPDAGLHVLIVYETAELTPRIAGIIQDAALREYLRANCAKDNGAPAFRFYDKDVDASADAKWIGNAMKLAKSAPWLIVSNGVSGVSIPLPADATAETVLDIVKLHTKARTP